MNAHLVDKGMHRVEFLLGPQVVNSLSPKEILEHQGYQTGNAQDQQDCPPVMMHQKDVAQQAAQKETADPRNPHFGQKGRPLLSWRYLCCYCACQRQTKTDPYFVEKPKCHERGKVPADCRQKTEHHQNGSVKKDKGQPSVVIGETLQKGPQGEADVDDGKPDG